MRRRRNGEREAPQEQNHSEEEPSGWVVAQEGEWPSDLGIALRGAVEGTAVLVAVAFAQHLQKQQQRKGKEVFRA